QLACESRLAQEPLDHDWVGHQPRHYELDRYVATDRALRPSVDGPHSAVAELFDDRVAAIEIAADQRVRGFAEPDKPSVVVGADTAAAERLLAGRAVPLSRRIRSEPDAHTTERSYHLPRSPRRRLHLPPTSTVHGLLFTN